MTIWRTMVRFFVCASFALALSATVNLSQTRDYDIDKSGKPVQVGGPGFGEDTAPAEDKQEETAEARAKATAEATAAAEREAAQKKTGSNFMYVFGAILGAIVLVFLVIRFLGRRKKGDEEEENHDERQIREETTVRETASSSPITSPHAREVREAREESTRTVTPVILLAGMLSLFGANTSLAADAASQTGNSYTLFPSAIPVGGSMSAVVTGPNAGNLTGCSVGLPNAGCSVSHVISPTQAMVRLTAGANAMGTRTEPLRGPLVLNFRGGSTYTAPNAIAVGTPAQIGTAMLSPHVNPQPVQVTTTVRRATPAPARPTAPPLGPSPTLTADEIRRAVADGLRDALPAIQQPQTPPPPVQQTVQQTIPPAELAQIRTDMASLNGRMGAAERQINTHAVAINQTNRVLEVTAQGTIANTRDKSDRCRLIEAYRGTGLSISSDQARQAGCK